jgi:hypothetical protein
MRLLWWRGEMSKKFDEYHFLLFLLTEIEEGKSNDFNFNDEFLKRLSIIPQEKQTTFLKV